LRHIVEERKASKVQVQMQAKGAYWKEKITGLCCGSYMGQMI